VSSRRRRQALCNGVVLTVGRRYMIRGTANGWYDGPVVIEHLGIGPQGLYIGAHVSPRPGARLRSGWGQPSRVLEGATITALRNRPRKARIKRLHAPTTPADVQHAIDNTKRALVHLKCARDLLKLADAPRAVAKVRRAITSAEGALRNAAARPYRTEREACTA